MGAAKLLLTGVPLPGRPIDPKVIQVLGTDGTPRTASELLDEIGI
jgi:hypothetical protein